MTVSTVITAATTAITAMSSRMHIHRALRPYRFTVVSDPFFVHGRYVVRTHDRFGRTMLVQIDLGAALSSAGSKQQA